MKLYLDENIPVVLCTALSSHGVDCLTTQQAGNLGLADAQQLVFATTEGRILVTFNRKDFLGSYRIHGSVLFHLSLCHARLPSSDACCPALLMDALMIRRALFERSELARPPVSCVHLIS